MMRRRYAIDANHSPVGYSTQIAHTNEMREDNIHRDITLADPIGTTRQRENFAVLQNWAEPTPVCAHLTDGTVKFVKGKRNVMIVQ